MCYHVYFDKLKIQNETKLSNTPSFTILLTSDTFQIVLDYHSSTFHTSNFQFYHNLGSWFAGNKMKVAHIR